MLTILAAVTFSCSRYQQLQPESIVSIYPVFKDTSIYHYKGYTLSGGAFVKYDKQNIYVKQYLAENVSTLDSFEKDTDVERLLKLIRNKKTFKPIPMAVKILPFKEFGYIKTEDGNIIFYGLGKDSFVDLTSDRVYH